MKSWLEMKQELEHLSYDEKLSAARRALGDSLGVLKRLYPNEWGRVLFCIFSSAVAADGTLSEAEERFIGALLDLPPHSVKMIAAGYNTATDDFVDQLVDYLPDGEREALILLVACVTACDENISRKENAFVERLIAR